MSYYRTKKILFGKQQAGRQNVLVRAPAEREKFDKVGRRVWKEAVGHVACCWGIAFWKLFPKWKLRGKP